MMKQKKHFKPSGEVEPTTCKCQICSNNVPFELPNYLLEKYANGNLVVFAGAGISTENKSVTPENFFERMLSEYCDGDKSIDFPAVMQTIENRPGGRIILIKEILDRIEYVRSFPDMYWEATRFHRELATMWNIDTIVTTNWDDFFERETGATPFVLSSDIPFWNSAKRRVLKVHGSIANLGTIVASTDDYANSTKALSRNLIGAKLKLLLAEKTVVFVGYSLRDSNIRKILKFVTKTLSRHQGQHYFISPFIEEEDISRTRSLGLQAIKTSGTHFLHTLKVLALCMTSSLSDSIYDEVAAQIDIMADIHTNVANDFNSRRYPTVIYSLSYQDGILHALRRIQNMRKLGIYSNAQRTMETIYQYVTEHRAMRLKQKRYEDVAYIDGYVEALGATIDCGNPQLETEMQLSPYYVFGSRKRISTLNHFKSELIKSKNNHKTAWKRANEYVLKNNFPNDGSIVFEHAVAI